MSTVDRYNCILYHASAGHDIEFASVAAVTESRDVMLRSRISRRGKICGAAVGLSDVGEQGLVAVKKEHTARRKTRAYLQLCFCYIFACSEIFKVR